MGKIATRGWCPYALQIDWIDHTEILRNYLQWSFWRYPSNYDFSLKASGSYTNPCKFVWKFTKKWLLLESTCHFPKPDVQHPCANLAAVLHPCETDRPSKVVTACQRSDLWYRCMHVVSVDLGQAAMTPDVVSYSCLVLPRGFHSVGRSRRLRSGDKLHRIFRVFQTLTIGPNQSKFFLGGLAAEKFL